jgi:DNA-binding NarL/FixJ family response regulator
LETHGVTQSTAIVIAPDPHWLAALSRALSASSTDVVKRTTSLRDAAAACDRSRFDLVVLDIAIRDGELTGAEWLSNLSQRSPAPTVIALSSSNDPDDIERALTEGASAYVVKPVKPDDVAAVARQLSERSFYLAAPQSNGVGPPGGSECGLTKRELVVLRHAAEGFTNNEIAARLWVTPQTVKFHLANAYRKLGAANRTEAALRAQEFGLLAGHPAESALSP